jgi:hypothetical protein
VGDTKRKLNASVVLLVVLATSCARLGSPHSVAPTPIVLYSSETDVNTVTPAPNAAAKLTSSDALDAFLTKNPGWQYKSDQPTSVQLGYLTTAVGDGTYTNKDRLVWGYTWNIPEVFMHPVPTDIPRSHTWWLFLDANTGDMLLGEWQTGA